MKTPSRDGQRIALVGAECEENLALRHIWAALEQAGHHVSLIVFNSVDDIDRAAAELVATDAALAGFSMVFTYRAWEFAQLAVRARELGFRGHLVAGGHFAAFNVHALLRDVPAIDSIAIGEGEALMIVLAAHLDDHGVVPGLVWRNTSGELVANPEATKPRHLDELPWPVRRNPPDEFLGLPIANVLSSRGCAHECDFCSIVAWHKLTGGARVRLRAPECVADEMAALYRQGYRIFNFHDDNFLFCRRDQNLARLWPFARAIRERGLDRIALAVKSRPDSVDRDVFTLLREMGVFRVFLGIEAGTEESLRRLGRGQTVADNERALEILNDLDLHVCFNLLLLNPDSTLEDFRANIEFLQQHPHNPLNFCRTEVYAGTPLEQRLREQGRLIGDYWGYGYRIADERAQRAFELMHRLLYDRHYPSDNLHHLTMRVDFERQLLAQFFDCPAPLRDRVTQFIVRVNRRTCEFLFEIADRARLPGADTTDLQQAIAADTDALTAEGLVLLDDIRAAVFRQPREQRPRVARAVGLVVSALVAAGTASCEKSPAPPPQAAERAGQSPADAPKQRPPDGNVELIKQQFRSAMFRLARYVTPPQDIEIELWLNDSGKVAEAFVFKSPRPAERPLTDSDKKAANQWITQLSAEAFRQREQAVAELTKLGPGVLPQVRAALEKNKGPEVIGRCQTILDALDATPKLPQLAELQTQLKVLQFTGSEVAGKRYVIPVTASELILYNNRFPTQICEMIAHPPN